MMPNFWQFAMTPILKIQSFHLTTVDFYAKTFPILYPCLENSTTGNAIKIILLPSFLVHFFLVFVGGVNW